MNDIENSKILFINKTDRLTNKFLLFSYVLLIIFLIFIFYFEFNTYFEIKGIVVKEEDAYIKLIMTEEELSNLQNNYIYYKNSKYVYRIDHIKDNEIFDTNYIKYLEVYIRTNLDKNILIKNNVLVINIERDKTTLKEIILKNIKKGMLK